MCGIAGIVGLGEQPVDARALRRMCDALAHRGPDDAGYALFTPPDPATGRGAHWCAFADPEFRHLNEHLAVFGGAYFHDETSRCRFSVGLGHRRLSIIDLTHTGHQPMASSDRRTWVVYNGEIYNHQAMRDELAARGCTFRTRSDTEVLLHLWEEYGERGLPRLDGMFAAAIYDRVENRLVLVRDRFGVKPLYYAISGGMLLFASEAKALFASGIVPAVMSRDGLAQYMTFQNVFGRSTIWEGVSLLQPGEFLECAPASARRPVLRRFHDAFPAPAPDLGRPEDLAGQVAEAFRAAVTRQLVSDVPVGSYLSGGMDSGSIVAVAGRSIPRLMTFTGGFDLTNVNGIEQGFDERADAEQLSYLLQTEHYAVVLHAGDMPAAMERIAWHMDDPRVGMCHQNWYVAKLASRFVKVCLAGTAGDELFAGYPWRYRPAFSAPDAAALDAALFSTWHRLLPAEELPRIFSPEMRAHLPAARAAMEDVLRGLPTDRTGAFDIDAKLARVLHFEFRTFLQGLLITDDHVSMAHGLETRVPFLDNALADLAFRIPAAAKIRLPAADGPSGTASFETADGKLVLRRAMEQNLPAEFVYRRKQGFSPPDANWYRGPSMDYIKEILLDRRTTTRPWFDQAEIARRLEEHFNGQQNHRLLIWSLLSVEWIQRHFADTVQGRGEAGSARATIAVREATQT